ncbi:Heavy metal resistance transcriptional regulator HmrR [hydrothermal vent metagenome]|uniref:Heavy metal resistance transcriptional regulator HmrR n=1 Tax=hydrothermal vent metagenome TaxID=652676 RepID=A0A3B1A2R2_9ZZZZ
MNQENSMGIGVLSEHTGCKVETIRYYERIGLLPDPPRSEGGHRIYGLEHLKRLTFIRRGRELGFTLDEVRTLLGLVDGGNYTCGEVRALTLKHQQKIQKKITDLKRLEKSLAEIAAQCEGGAVPECPVIDALFVVL